MTKDSQKADNVETWQPLPAKMGPANWTGAVDATADKEVRLGEQEKSGHSLREHTLKKMAL